MQNIHSENQFQQNSGLEVMRIAPKLPFLYVSTGTKLPTPIRHHTTRNLEEVNHSKSKQIQGIRLNNNNPSLDFGLTFMHKVSWVSYDGSRCSAQTVSRLRADCGIKYLIIFRQPKALILSKLAPMHIFSAISSDMAPCRLWPKIDSQNYYPIVCPHKPIKQHF